MSNNSTYIKNNTLANIANAIRVMSESSNTYYPNQMANAILAIGKSEGEVPTEPILSDAFMLQPNLHIDRFWVDYDNNTETGILISDTYSSLPIYADIKYQFNDEGVISGIANFNLYSNAGSRSTPLYLPQYANYTFANCNSEAVMQYSESAKFNTKYTKTMFHTFDSVKVNHWTVRISDNVINMAYAFNNCHYLKGNAYCGNRVTNMAYAYANSHFYSNALRNPECGPAVLNMANVFENCMNLTGSPNVGPNVLYMQGSYLNCRRITGSPVIPSKVINADNAYSGCWNLAGHIPTLSQNLMVADYVFAGCNNLTGYTSISNGLFSMYGMFSGCSKINGYAYCGNEVFDMSSAYEGCSNLTGGLRGNTSNLRYAVSAFLNSSAANMGDNGQGLGGGDWYLYWNDVNDNSYKSEYRKNAAIVWRKSFNNGANDMWYTVYANRALGSRNPDCMNRLNIHVPANGAWNNYLFNEGLQTLVNTLICDDGRNSYYAHGNTVVLDSTNRRYCLTGSATLYGHNIHYNLENPVGNLYIYYDL